MKKEGLVHKQEYLSVWGITSLYKGDLFDQMEGSVRKKLIVRVMQDLMKNGQG